jgi:hypothetical protein
MNKSILLLFFYFPNNGSLYKVYIVFYEKAIVFNIYHTFKILNNYLSAAFLAESGFEPTHFLSQTQRYNHYTNNGDGNKVPTWPGG